MLKRTLRRALCVALTLALSLSFAARSSADKASKEDRTAAAELTAEALHREVYAEQEERDNLLLKALARDPNYAPARWHQGYVWRDSKWRHADSIPQLNDEDARLRRYEFIREKTPDTMEGHLELANWCRKRSLVEQQKAHLTRVLDFDSNHAAARNQLGFRRVGANWVSPDEAKQAFEQGSQARESIAKWRTKLEGIRRGLMSGKRRREAAATQLRNITDVRAIPALEAVFINDSEQSSMLVIEALAKMPQFQAAQSLARIAVFSPGERVREAAATKLQSRRVDTYAPMLLTELYSPIQTRTRILPGPGGRLVYRHEFIREGQDERQHMVLDTAYRRRARPGGNRNQTLSRAFLDVFLTERQRDQQLERQNNFTQLLNRRITAALDIATKQQLGDRPEAWWKWWNDYNEVFVKSEKGVNGIYRSREIALTDISQTPSTSSGGSGRSTPPPRASFDCLAAGTKVWTNRGAKAIETLQVGDLLLSQSPETGELAYKPVVRTTVRPKGQLVRIRAGNEVIETSGGHLFWAAGDGWVKARDLRSGMVLHGMGRVTHLSTVEKGPQAETYNVVIADFHTYFVGQNRILSHDNTIRQPTNAAVPGLLVK